MTVREGDAMPGPFIVWVGQRPSPFRSGELDAWIGDGHVVLAAGMAWSFDERQDAHEAARGFDGAEVRDTRDVADQRLPDLAMMACETAADMAAHLVHSPSMQRLDREGWRRAISVPDTRCPAGAMPGRMALWRRALGPLDATGPHHAA